MFKWHPDVLLAKAMAGTSSEGKLKTCTHKPLFKKCFKTWIGSTGMLLLAFVGNKYESQLLSIYFKSSYRTCHDNHLLKLKVCPCLTLITFQIFD